MVYLDYAANTPVEPEVLDAFYKANTEFIANPNSTHSLGKEAGLKVTQIKDKISRRFEKEVIFTSGASEANNIAIKGIAQEYKNSGKHIITSALEHSSVSGAISYLKSIGYEVDFVDILDNGKVDLECLKELIREDTILVSIGYLDSELGIIQPVNEIAELVMKYPDCFFHCDATQAVGKVQIEFENIDLISFAPHKFYGLNGIGVLLKSENVRLSTFIHGGISLSDYRSGTPDLAGIVAFDKSLDKALSNLGERLEYVEELNEELRKQLINYKLVKINSPTDASPYILNISVIGVKAYVFKEALEKHGICISIKSACSNEKTMSIPVYSVTKDKKLASSSWRISLSHLTTMDEVGFFLKAFDIEYNNLTKKEV